MKMEASGFHWWHTMYMPSNSMFMLLRHVGGERYVRCETRRDVLFLYLMSGVRRWHLRFCTQSCPIRDTHVQYAQKIESADRCSDKIAAKEQKSGPLEKGGQSETGLQDYSLTIEDWILTCVSLSSRRCANDKYSNFSAEALPLYELHLGISKKLKKWTVPCLSWDTAL